MDEHCCRSAQQALPNTRSLCRGWIDFVGVKNASKYGVGGIIVGEAKACMPTVFRAKWPEDTMAELVSDANPSGTITILDLECAGLLLLWMILEGICNLGLGSHAALFSNNQPTVHRVQRLVSKSLQIMGQLLRVLALQKRAPGIAADTVGLGWGQKCHDGHPV